MTGAQLDELSLVVLYTAMAVYALAFIGFAVDLARRSAIVAAAAERQPVAVVAGETSAAAGTSSGAVGGSSAAVSSTAGNAIAYGRSASLRVGVALTVLGFVLHFAATMMRGIAAERVPWANMYEFALTGTLVMISVYLVALAFSKTDLRWLGTFILGLVVLFLGVATVNFYVSVVPLPPALQSAWLVIHVFVAVTATGLFALGFALSVLQLLQAKREHSATPNRGGLRFLGTLPTAESLESFAYRVNIIGFIMWTFTLVAGAIWAERAWGRYWGWDTKEVWTFIIWVLFAGYIHARATRGWRGNRAAWLAIIGFSALIFNFTVVNLFFKGLHAYSGL